MKNSQEEVQKNKVKSNFEIQDYLSIGYIFLLILGVFYETIYYKFLGINILEYSSVLDVLISPVSVIAKTPFLLIIIIIAIVIGLIYAKFLPKYYKRLEKKEKYQSGKYKEKLDKASAQVESKQFSVIMPVVFVFSMFLGLGIGKGIKGKEKINSEEIKFTHELVFEDGVHQNIRMLGKNSLYIFYISKTKGELSISPIDGNIKTIKKLKKED